MTYKAVQFYMIVYNTVYNTVYNNVYNTVCRIKQTGEIFVSKTLDRESLTEYHLEVSATDGVFVSSIMVLIHILDANDNAPVCERVSAHTLGVIAYSRCHCIL